jgi:hypothetical protein
MNRILLLLFLVISYTSQGQECIKLYIQKLENGSRLCGLGQGDEIELCEEDWGRVRICPRDLFISKRGYRSGMLTYDLSIGVGFEAHMVLTINPKTNLLMLNNGHEQALYSYLNESEMKQLKELERQKKALEDMKKLQEDQSNYPIINNHIYKNDYITTSQIIKKLNFPEKYPMYDDYLKLENRVKNYEDIKLKNKIDSLLILNDSKSALDLYNKINFYETRNVLKPKLEKSLTEYYKQNPKEFSKSELNEFISKYNTVFKTVNPGIHTLKIDTDGTVFIDEITINQKSDVFFLNLGTNLSIPSIKKADFELVQKEENIDKERFTTSSTREISKTIKGDYYKVNYFTYSLFFHNHINTTLNSELPKNTYQIVQPIKVSKYINDKLISEEVKSKVIKEGKFKKRIGKIILRSITSVLVVLLYLSWSSNL